jgi:hypothetical protein
MIKHAWSQPSQHGNGHLSETGNSISGKSIPLMKNPKTVPRIHLFHEITGKHTMQGQQFMVQSTDLEDLQGLNNSALLVCATYIPETDLSIIRPRQ